ncbi:YdcF family protein [Wenzhouxiangella marina]|uniref:Uncharacterized ACR, COG1434 family n=1 Tax=Wenzhouxiangella marina TaxID=1579979 RepID=A0A0K0XYI6_9GAMM|nr:YdcF family protein [Wenzhouxiangella marina]AKS42748.1 Uncharacterized ACR, COG1434 family [Wenzhouxiangella marina]MBB6087576.1 uncharacterized SAM-binding protein YcdF (DUF218 family) [Wenzhouxiangella marina]
MAELLDFLIYPLGTFFAALLLGLLLLFLRRRAWGAICMAAGLAWLTIWSMPLFSDWAIERFEAAYPPQAAEVVEPAQAIVVLGGGLFHRQGWVYPDGNVAVDRYWHAARLYQAGRAPLIVVAGGHSPDRQGQTSEAEAGRAYLLALGVPNEAIVLESESSTTHENAINVAALARVRGWDELILVTSALHMRRSLAAFRSAGLDPVPAATDYHWGETTGSWTRNLLPNANSLRDSTRLIHEIVGLWYYRLKGWA